MTPPRIAAVPAPGSNWAPWLIICGGILMIVSLLILAYRSTALDELRARIDRNHSDTQKVQKQVEQIEGLYR